MRDLGDLAPYSYSSAYGINDAAQVVGVSVTANRQSHAFITGANGMGMRDLGTLGGNYSYAFSINDTGQVVGYSGTTEGNTRAFISGPNGAGLTNLGTLFDSINSKLGVSHAYDINDAGQVVGRSVSRWGSDHAFITGADGAGMSDLGTLSGDLSDLSVAHSINNTGRVVGYSATSSGTYHAFITGPDGVGMRDLGTLGGNDSSALGINDAGQAVGRSRMSWGTDHAFITSADGIGMTDLNSLVDLPGGIILTDAVDINNVGQVIAFGVIPEPEAYALFLAGLGLMGVITSRNRLLV
ncbi:DUF3466 family protein [Nitrosospira sp. Nsp14]|uniref:DUF3466 family protein n=1 Tax=Nitrosospira sp. Nsp14 TaxID=1855333 RepID=UPI003526D054